jgi:hypothetical protein
MTTDPIVTITITAFDQRAIPWDARRSCVLKRLVHSSGAHAPP